MADPELASSKVCFPLANPHILQDDWKKIWFDRAHCHSLLFNSESCFYTQSYTQISTEIPSNVNGSQWSISDDVSSFPRLFYHFQDLQSTVIFAAISLDFEFIAVQTSQTTIFSVDTANNKKWLIEIRFPHDNYILPEGIIWSDHGGNSQDLVIITAKGIELYKVSSSRGQCKLSRIVGQPIFHFWYEPRHRMILLASQQSQYANEGLLFLANMLPDAVGMKSLVNSRFNSGILLMDGCYLKSEPSAVPLLELPPPDKIPRFELGPNVCCDDIALVSLYGRVFCLVKYTSENLDYISLFLLSKTTVEKIHSLALNCLAERVTYSVCDNILVCHSSSLRASLAFDIFRTPKKNKLSTNSASPEAFVVHPVLPVAHPAYFVDSISKESLYVSSIFQDPSVSRGSVSVSRQSLSEHADVAYIVGDRRSSLGDIAPSASFSFQRETLHRPAMSRPMKSFSHSLEKGLIATELYMPGIFDFLGEGGLVWDSNRKVIWVMRLNLTAMQQQLQSSHYADHGEFASFLLRRGQVYTPRSANSAATASNAAWSASSSSLLLDYDCSQTLETGLCAKQLLLSSLRDNLTSGNLRVFTEICAVCLRSYRMQYEVNQIVRSMKGSTLGEPTGPSGLAPPLLSALQSYAAAYSLPLQDLLLSRPNLAVSLQSSKGKDAESGSGLGSSSIRASISIAFNPRQMSFSGFYSGGQFEEELLASREAAEKDKGKFKVDLTPLDGADDFDETHRAVFKDIDSIGRALRDQKSVTLSTMASMPYVLRRDNFGDIIITQTEMLLSVWLPHFAAGTFPSSNTAVNVHQSADSSLLALTTYINMLKGAQGAVGIAVSSSPTNPPKGSASGASPAVAAGAITVIAPLYSLLMTALHSKKAFRELSLLASRGFFSSSPYASSSDTDSQNSVTSFHTAVEALQISQRIYQMLTDRSQRASQLAKDDIYSALEAVRDLKAFGQDTLLQLGQGSTLVQWLLDTGRVMDAIDICWQQLNWQRGIIQ